MDAFSQVIKTVILHLALASLAIGQTVIVTTANDEFDTPSGVRVSLREAVRDLGTTGGTVEFGTGLSSVKLDSTLVASQGGGRITIEGGDGVTITAAQPFSGTYLMDLSNRDFTFNSLNLQGFGMEASGGPESGVRFETSRGRINDCVFSGWRTMALFYYGPGAWGDIQGAEFRDNGEGIRFTEVRNLWVDHAVFYHNRSFAISGSGNTSVNGADGTGLRVRNVTIAENSGPRALRFTGVFDPTDAFDIAYTTIVDNAGVAFEGPPGIRIGHCLFARNIPPAGNSGSVSIFEKGSVPGANSVGFNLADDSPAAFNHAEDITGSAVKVSRLGDFGGERYSCFPLDGSAAIDGGDPDRSIVGAAGIDGRGFDRKARVEFSSLPNIVDIGAVETNPEGTLVVDSNASGTGPGTLGAALAAATGETAHIVFRVGFLTGDFFLTDTIQVDGSMNYNFDGSFVSFGGAEFAGAQSAGPLFEIGNSAGTGFTTASFHSFIFRDDLSDGSKEGGCFQVRSNAKLNLHRSSFENNITAATGVVDLGGSNTGIAELFVNECSFIDNTQINSSGFPNEGGTALRMNQSRAIVWNSTFLRNQCVESPIAFNANGGAVRLGDYSRANFRQCTFADNQVRNTGSAIYSEDNGGALIDTLVLDRCTFAGNLTLFGEGAIGFENRARLRIRNAVFTGNLNGGDPSGTSATRDLYAAAPTAVTLTEVGPNWTDAPSAFAGLIKPANLNYPVSMAPPADWGGEVPTMPWISGAQPSVDAGSGSRSYARDAVNDTGFSSQSLLSLPGAVQATVAPQELVSVVSYNKIGDKLIIEATGKSGVLWEIEVSPDLNNFTATGLRYLLESTPKEITIPLPSSTTDAYFLRFFSVIPDGG